MNRFLIISESQFGHAHQEKIRCISFSRLASSTLEPASCSRRVLSQAFKTTKRCNNLSLRVSAQEQAETVAESSVTEEKAKKRRGPGRQTYRPQSFQELVNDATASVRAAVEDGLTRLEVEFPALPGNIDGKCPGLRPCAGHAFCWTCLALCPQMLMQDYKRRIQGCFRLVH